MPRAVLPGRRTPAPRPRRSARLGRYRHSAGRCNGRPLSGRPGHPRLDHVLGDQRDQLAEMAGHGEQLHRLAGIASVGHSRCIVARALALSGPQQTFRPPWTGRSPPPDSR